MFDKSLIIFVLFYLTYSIKSIEIKSWTLTNANKSIVLRKVISPIDVYSSLYQYSIIDWPLTQYNDVAYRWISHDNWTFTSDVFCTSPSNQSSLSLPGLDVYPLIILNNQVINITTSEFYSVDISIDPNLLKGCNNVLQLKFLSPQFLAKKISDGLKTKVPPDCWPKIFNGECHINMLRKTQSSFGWDWGPAIPTMGIQGKIDLKMTNKMLVSIKGVKFLTNSDDDCQIWSVYVNVKLQVLQVMKSHVCVTMELKNLKIKKTNCISTADSSIYYTNFNLKLNTFNLKLWWPRDMGTPTAYKLEVTATYYDSVLDRSIDYVGFRQVKLDQSHLTNSKGRHFRFNINCKPFFVKGTNWVPRSYLSIEWNNESYLKFLMSSIANANINTIRVWGGGRPEIKLFYTIADRLGIMVWHDLMFAGSLYPDNNEFYTEINNEISDLLWNIQKHPSILLWSGNNEIELLIADGWYNTTTMDQHNIDSYYRTFVKVIQPLVNSLDPFTPFVLSSPSNGIESERNGGVSKNPQSPYYGDVHYYLYSGDLWDERSYPITRMTTEFGFQSYPSADTWALIALSDNDFEPNGRLANHRQHLVNGFEISERAIIQYFGKTAPHGNLSVRNKYTWFSYLSQLNQAMILRSHINRLRSSECILTSTGEGYTSGAMYWQLNDNWIAPSWSTIESNGQWKLSHYFVKNAFANQRIITTINDGMLIVRLVLPESMSVPEYNVSITCVDTTQTVDRAVTGVKYLRVSTRDMCCNVATILSVPVSDFLGHCNCTKIDKCIITARLMNQSNELSFDTVMTVKPKDLHLSSEVSNDVIKFTIQNGDPDLSVCIVTLSAKFVHLFVGLYTSTLGTFSTNGFHLLQNKLNVTFDPWYNNQTTFFNCSNLKVNVISLNGLLI